jgi:tRNA(Arg) A34 adenosine deaminase TadA
MSTSFLETITIQRLDEAAKLALRSGILSYKTGAVIYSPMGVAIATGWSHYSEFNLAQYRSIHAELHAVLRSPLKTKLKGATVYVATVRAKNGNTTLSKPCKLCMALLHESGLKAAYYTCGDSSYEVISLSNQ